MNENPVLYSKNNGVQSYNSNFYLDEYFENFKPKDGAVLADIGCGDGSFTKNNLVPRFPNYKKIVGFDISPIMIEHCKKIHENEKIKFQVLDIGCENLPKKFINKFDYVFTFFCLHWVHDRQLQALKNMYDMLKMGGEAFVLLLGSHPFYKLYKAMATYEKYSEYTAPVINKIYPVYHDWANKKEWYESLLKEAGFKINYCKLEDRKSVYYSLEEYVSALKAITPYAIPDHLQDDYFRDIVEETEKRGWIHGENNSKTYEFEFKHLIASVSKI